MAILVTGSTGQVGSQVVDLLAGQGADIRALTKDPAKARFPAGVTPVKGDLMDPASMRSALAGTKTLFLLNAVAPDELTQALIALNLAREAGVAGVVYFSVLNGGDFTDVPHFASKLAVERAIDRAGVPATVLCNAYFFQNDAGFKDPVLGHGVYPMAVGAVGLSMVDTRDAAEVAALSLAEREDAADPPPPDAVDVAGPDILTGEAIAAIWSEALGRPVSYGGDDLDAFERRLGAQAPGWMAYDTRVMMGNFQRHGMAAAPEAIERLARMLGRPLRAYRDFARETAAKWRQG